MKYKLPKIEELFDAGTHYGHQVRRWHPKMAKYIYTAKDHMHIVDLEQTAKNLEKSCDFLYEIAKKGGQIIFVGTKRQARSIIESEAKKCGALFVNERWLGGTMTNFKMIKKNVDKLLTNIKKRELGEFNKYTKKERLLIDREIDNLQKYVGGLVGLRGIPSALFVVDPRKEKTAVKEALKSNLPIIALVDTNSDPTNINIVIPGNDDAIKSISIVLGSISEAINEGYKEYAKTKDNEASDAKDAQDAKDKLIAEEKELPALRVVGVELTKEIADKEIVKAINTPIEKVIEAPKEDVIEVKKPVDGSKKPVKKSVK